MCRSGSNSTPDPGGATRFVVLLAVLSAPFLIAGFFAPNLLPNLPATALMFVCPAIAALILAYRRGGRDALAAMAWRAADLRRVRRPEVAVLIAVLPAAMLASQLADGLWGAPPAPLAAPAVTDLAVLALIFAFAGICEELGWCGLLLPALEPRCGSLGGAVVIAAVWSLWHLVPYAQTNPWGWVVWQMLHNLPVRIFLVWVFLVSGRSVAFAGLVHGSENLAWQGLADTGAAYNPALMTIATGVPVLLIIASGGFRERRATP